MRSKPNQVRIYLEKMPKESRVKSWYFLTGPTIEWVKVVKENEKYIVYNQKNSGHTHKSRSFLEAKAAEIRTRVYLRKLASRYVRKGYELVDELPERLVNLRTTVEAQIEEAYFEINRRNIKHISKEESEKYLKRGKGLEFN